MTDKLDLARVSSQSSNPEQAAIKPFPRQFEQFSTGNEPLVLRQPLDRSSTWILDRFLRGGARRRMPW